MELQSLKLLVTEQDINGLLARHLPRNKQVRDLRVELREEGVNVLGSYAVSFLKVHFQTLWQVSVQGGRLAINLAGLEVAGIPAGMVRSTLLGLLAETARPEEGLQVEGETLWIDLDLLLKKKAGLDALTRLQSFRLAPGTMILEAGVSG